MNRFFIVIVAAANVMNTNNITNRLNLHEFKKIIALSRAAFILCMQILTDQIEPWIHGPSMHTIWQIK